MPRILLVEDDPINRVLIARRIAFEGYEVISVGDGLEAIERAQLDQPDLILMDIKLPRLDGWEATRRLKMSPQTQAIPVVVLTAYALDEDRQRSKDAGGDAYVTKPIDFDELFVTMGLLLKAEG